VAAVPIEARSGLDPGTAPTPWYRLVPAEAGNLKTKVFPTRDLRVLTLKDGKREVRVVC
jgi:hypothetical protein